MIPLAPTTYWRGRVDEKLTDHGEAIDELREDVDDLQRARWKFSGVLAVVIVFASLTGGCLATVAAYLILAALHNPAAPH